MRRRFFFICFFSGIVITLIPTVSFADSIDSARSILESSRSLKASDAIAVLEKGLLASGALRPYYVVDLARLYGESGNWPKVESLCSEFEADANVVGTSSVPVPSVSDGFDNLADQIAWWHSLSFEKQGFAAKAASVAGKRIETGRVADPAVYLAWFKNASSGTELMLERFNKAFPDLKKNDRTTFALSRYLAGLSATREGAWACAGSSLAEFSASDEKTFPELAPWSRYYRAWSLYRLGKWKESVSVFASYLDAWPNHAYAWQAATAASLASLQAGFDALPFADRAVKLAPSDLDRAASSLLVASILYDRKKYTESESVLAGIADGSSSNGLTPSAPRALFTLGEISVRLKRADDAEKRWLSVGTRFPNDPLAEESLYRAAEMRYLGKNWSRSAEIFTQYRQKYPQGRFLEVALRTGGEALSLNGSVDLAILWWEDLVKKYPASPAVPGTLSDLIDAYRTKGEYDAAVATAEKYREKYPSESKADGLDRTIAELAVLKKGRAPGVASLISDWDTLGHAKTPEGRTAGLSLARKYLSDYGTRSDAKNILKEISAKAPQKPDQADPSERSTFAVSLSLYGSMCRNDADYRTASRMLLAAGNWYASIDGERSAEALYGAIDSFLQSGFRADAEKTMETLVSTWPDSVWTKRAHVLMEQ